MSSLLTEHGSGEGAAVVGGCHDFTVGTGGAESDEVSTVGEGKLFVLAEDIAAFANRTNDMDALASCVAFPRLKDLLAR